MQSRQASNRLKSKDFGSELTKKKRSKGREQSIYWHESSQGRRRRRGSLSRRHRLLRRAGRARHCPKVFLLDIRDKNPKCQKCFFKHLLSKGDLLCELERERERTRKCILEQHSSARPKERTWFVPGIFHVSGVQGAKGRSDGRTTWLKFSMLARAFHCLFPGPNVCVGPTAGN